LKATTTMKKKKQLFSCEIAAAVRRRNGAPFQLTFVAERQRMQEPFGRRDGGTREIERIAVRSQTK